MESRSVNPAHDAAVALVQQLKSFYGTFNTQTIAQLNSIYTQDIEFRDPVHTINGSLALKRYLLGMAKNLQQYRIRYLDEQVGQDSAYLTWELDYSHKLIKRGATISVRGMSHVKFTAKIYHHEDCYDMGALLYDHLPGLGTVTRHVKKRMSGHN